MFPAIRGTFREVLFCIGFENLYLEISIDYKLNSFNDIYNIKSIRVAY
jgi:hypothetical protein